MRTEPMLPILASVKKGEPIPAISLRQPWAGAVVWLGKDVENRSNWPFKYRGPIIIHAAATKPYLEDFERAIAMAREDGGEAEDLALCDPNNEEQFAPVLFSLGAIVAVAELLEVFGPEDDVPEGHAIDGSPWAEEEANYWLHLGTAVPVEPIPYKGAVGLFKIPYDVAASLKPFPLEDGEEEGADS